MPYQIIKVPKGYFVINKITKRRFSKHPLTLETAKRQIRALYTHYKGTSRIIY